MKITAGIFIGLTVVALSVQPACSQRVKLDIPTTLRHAGISLIVSETTGGTTIAALNAERSATPASITKLMTTATALEMLGDDFRFATAIACDGTLHDGTLDGNLYIVGDGDPSLGSRYTGETDFLNHWCEKLRQCGIRQIGGDIVADASIYDRTALPPRWTWEDIGNYYAAGVFGLSVFDNTIGITMRTGAVGSRPTILDVAPHPHGLQLDNQLVVTHTKTDSAYIYGIPYNNRRLMTGAVPENRSRFVLKGDLPNPPLCAAEQLAAQLRANGIAIAGTATDQPKPEGGARTILFEHRSQPLSELCRIVNFNSNNNYAEHLLRRLAPRTDAPATHNAALQAVTDFWKRRGIDFGGVSLNDGSGLSPMNAFPATFLNDILIQMAKSPHFDTFLGTIPRAGKEGSVAHFMKTEKSADIYAKSGSMDGVQAYAGYIVKNGTTYSFCIMVNHFDRRQDARRAIEQWLHKIIATL